MWKLDADDWKAYQKGLRKPNGQPDHAAIGRATALRESGAESAVLDELVRANATSMNALCDQLEVEPVVVNGALRRLKDKGLIEEQGSTYRISGEMK